MNFLIRTIFETGTEMYSIYIVYSHYYFPHLHKSFVSRSFICRGGVLFLSLNFLLHETLGLKSDSKVYLHGL